MHSHWGFIAKKEALDDDPVTAEYDVFIAPELQEKLYLLQFPTREREKPYNEAYNNKPSEMRIKPRSGFVEVDVPISTAFHYDRRKAKAWSSSLAKSKSEGSTGHGMSSGFAGSAGLRSAPQRTSDRNAAPENLSDDEEDGGISHQTLGGQLVHHERGKPVYMIGAFRGAELHLTRLDGVVQMRPQFHHIDAKSQVERTKARRDREAVEPPKPTEPRIVQQMVKSAHHDNYELTDTKDILQAAHEEPWSHLKYRDEEEEEAYRRYHGKLFLQESKKAPRLTASMDNETYLETISAPRIDARGRTRVKPLTKRQKIQIELSESEESEAEPGAE